MIVGEPGAFYLFHVAQMNGTVVSIVHNVFYTFVNGQLRSKLSIIACDETTCVTGSIKKLICYLKELLLRTLLWTIYLLHCDEL